MNKVIQLIHPIGEHKKGHKKLADDVYLKQWNRGSHKRKFIQTHGIYFNEENEKPQQGNFQFWGEYEPESISIPALNSGKSGFPNRVCFPVYISPKDRRQYIKKEETILGKLVNIDDKRKVQNTDPFVFGKRFYYTCCKKQLIENKVGIGDIILFGSKDKFKGFLLDTVFVIKDIISIQEWVERIASKNEESIFYNTVVRLLKNDCNNSQKTIIIGASYDDPYKDMYSFVPCNNNSFDDGHQRIYFPDNNDLGLSAVVENYRVYSDIDCKLFWGKLRKYCFENSYCIGVNINTPKEICDFDSKSIEKIIENIR